MAADSHQDEAERFVALFMETYLSFHRRTGPRSALSGPSRAVLLHLAATGPVTIGEAAQHLKRTQSVVSEIVTRLERRGLLERESDPTDRRRTFVRLTSEGIRSVHEEQQVLDDSRLRDAFSRLPAGQAHAMLETLSELLVDRSASPQSPRKDGS